MNEVGSEPAASCSVPRWQLSVETEETPEPAGMAGRGALDTGNTLLGQ